MNLKERLNTFVVLGDFLRQFTTGKKNENLQELNHRHYDKLASTIENAFTKNQWFSKEMVLHAIGGICQLLEYEKLEKWIGNYKELSPSNTNKTVALIMAGNIPLVGFHDLLCVLICGNKLLAKTSSKDDLLPIIISELLFDIHPEFQELITITEEQISDFDAVIATGSDNSARYFEYYFEKYPHIIRKNRNSAAIITEKEDKADFLKLADDIFLYFGLGCRNVSKLYAPKNYDFTRFFQSMEKYAHIKNHNKYANNVEYRRTLLLMNQTPHLDNGFLLLKEDTALSSPIAVLNVEYYDELSEVEIKLAEQTDFMQCIASQNKIYFETVPFGQTQQPGLSDYADNIDTMKFLLSL